MEIKMKFNNIDTRYALVGPISYFVLWYFATGFALFRFRDRFENRLIWWTLNFIYQPVIWAFAIIDLLFNWVIGTFMFAEFPREFMFTERLRRWAKIELGDDIYKNAKIKQAFYICGLLGRSDPNHCGGIPKYLAMRRPYVKS